MKKRLFDLIKIVVLLLIFFNIGPIIGNIFTSIGFNVSKFNYIDLAYSDLLITLIITLLVFGFYAKTLINDWNKFTKDLKRNLLKSLKLFISLFGVKILVSVIITIITNVLDINLVQSENQNALELLLKSAPVIMFISAAILGPLVEESIFRLGFKKVIKNSKLFIIVSSLVFGLMHVFPTDLNLTIALLQSVVYIAMGAVLAHFYEEENNIYIVIVVHVLNNLFGILAALIFI